MDQHRHRPRTSALAGAAAATGLVGGVVLGARRRPSPARELAREIATAGRALADLQADLRAVREQADRSRKQSPVEVLLSALTSRRIPRHD
jgi:hypothetical protein